MDVFPDDASVPPKVGEYAYFDARLSNAADTTTHWMVTTNTRPYDVGCHYSLTEEKDRQAFITCHGVISKTNQRIINHGTRKTNAFE